MKNIKAPRLIVVSAPSGAGKTTLCDRLIRDFSQLRLSISSTTRAPRGQEKHGVAYFFLTKEEFQKQIREDRFAEWAEVHGNFYGTSKDFIDSMFKQGHSVLLDIDVQGAASLRHSYPDCCSTVFIAPPSLAVLEARLRARGTETEESIRKRLINAQSEMSEMPKFDCSIVNDELDHAYSRLKSWVEGEFSV